MVKFSDLKGNGDKPVQKAGGDKKAAAPRKSKLSFSRLDKDSRSSLSETLAPSDSEIEKSRQALYERASAYLREVFAAIRQRQKFSLEPGIRIVENIIDVKIPNDPLLIRAIHSDDPYTFLIGNCVNVAIFAIKIGENIGYDRNRLIEIGLAGLLHEVGMGVIPETLIYKKEKLSSQEFDVFKKRTEYSYKILSVFGDAYAYLAGTAVQLQERIDGTGYPMGLKGDEISEYAQIVGLADMYEALIHSRPQREKFLHFFAVKEIIKTGKKCFQKKYIKALINIFTLFPIDSYVKLNSNAIGLVIETYPEQPMRPKLQIVVDSQGRRVLTDRIVDLKENSILFVVDSISEEEVKNLSKQVFDEKAAREADERPQGETGGDFPATGDQGAALSFHGLPDMSEEKQKASESLEFIGDVDHEKEIASLIRRKRKRRKPRRGRVILVVLALLLLLLGILWQLGWIRLPAPAGAVTKHKIIGKSAPMAQIMLNS